MAEETEKVVLADSGGLDTSICIKWLQLVKNLDVIAMIGEVGQEHDGLEAIRQKALRTGADRGLMSSICVRSLPTSTSRMLWLPTPFTRTSTPCFPRFPAPVIS